MDKMYFTIEKAGLLNKRFRARMFAGNHELVWHTQTYADKRDAHKAVEAWVRLAARTGVDIPIKDLT